MTPKTPATNAKWVTSAPLPTRHGTFDAHIFHGVDRNGIEDGREHVAMVFGGIVRMHGAKGIPVRVHSECMTSEVFGSLKCDCKEQLESALAEIAREGHGALLYLRQEGRGIGLTNKIRAYGLQAQGYDTVDANRMLGLPDDLREYGVAADMLAHFGVESIRLLTNNPDKVEKMRALGIDVVSRQPVLIPPNEHSAGYLEAKRLRMAHELPNRSAPADGTNVQNDEAPKPTAR